MPKSVATSAALVIFMKFICLSQQVGFFTSQEKNVNSKLPLISSKGILAKFSSIVLIPSISKCQPVELISAQYETLFLWLKEENILYFYRNEFTSITLVYSWLTNTSCRPLNYVCWFSSLFAYKLIKLGQQSKYNNNITYSQNIWNIF